MGAVVSNQSEVVPSRAYLEKLCNFDSMVIPRPKHWAT
jgi:pyridoxamine 5'-phosphate oxidase